MNLIVISINVDINKKKDEIFSEKSSFTEMKNLLADQLFSELSIVILAEIFSTFNSLTVKIPLTAKSALMILCHFSHRAVKTVLKNIDLSNSVILNSVSQIVRVTLPANQASAISDSNFQAVKVISLAHRSCD